MAPCRVEPHSPEGLAITGSDRLSIHRLFALPVARLFALPVGKDIELAVDGALFRIRGSIYEGDIGGDHWLDITDNLDPDSEIHSIEVREIDTSTVQSPSINPANLLILVSNDLKKGDR